MGVDANTSGTVYFDDFESHRFTYIGLLPDPGIPDPEPEAQPSWLDASYNYDGDQPHAVTSVVRDQSGGGDVTDSYEYDENGNMTCRVEDSAVYKHVYNEENRVSRIDKYNGSTCASPGSVTDSWEFSYDGDGNRVKEVYKVSAVVQYTKYFFGGGMYEFSDDGTDVTYRKYYNIGGMMVAMKEWVNQGAKTTYYFANDHLSSTSIVMNSSGSLLSENRYMPFGEVRTISGTTQISETDFGYTGQRDYGGDFGLMDYRARFYSPRLGRFTQPDTIGPSGTQGLNRYSFVKNNPIKFNDPTGHMASCALVDGLEGRGSNCSGRELSVEQKLNLYGVDVEGKWTEEDMQIIYEGVREVAYKFAEKTNKRATVAFKAIYGIDYNNPLTFVMGSCEPRNGKGGCGDPAKGAYTWGSKEIEFAERAPFYRERADRPPEIAFQMSVHGVVHELGHAFAARFKSGPSNPYTMAGNDPDILSVEGYQTSEHEGMWRANSSTRENESFANTFTGWVYDEFDNDADGIGDHRREFMEDNMNNVWIPILITP